MEKRLEAKKVYQAPAIIIETIIADTIMCSCGRQCKCGCSCNGGAARKMSGCGGSNCNCNGSR